MNLVNFKKIYDFADDSELYCMAFKKYRMHAPDKVVCTLCLFEKSRLLGH